MVILGQTDMIWAKLDLLATDFVDGLNRYCGPFTNGRDRMLSRSDLLSWPFGTRLLLLPPISTQPLGMLFIVSCQVSLLSLVLLDMFHSP